MVLAGIEIVTCKKCGNADPIIRNLSGLMCSLAEIVARKPYRLRGEEIRFLRKYLEMSAKDFAVLLCVDASTLSKWENNEDPVGPQSDKLIRMAALTLGDGLKDFLESVVRHDFPKIESKAKNLSYKYNQSSQTCEYSK